MTDSEKRAWLYGLGWLGSGIAACGLAVWLIMLIRWDWPSDRAEQQIAILGNALFFAQAMMALVILGLSIRNAIRTIKGTLPGGASFEASGPGDGAQQAADAAQDVADELKGGG